MSEPIHIVQYQKSEKVLKVYSGIGKFLTVMLVLSCVSLMGGILWWVFAENLWQLLILAAAVGVLYGASSIARHYEKHRRIVERAKQEGTIDD